MKNPFKKADSAKLPEQGKERTEIDYAQVTPTMMTLRCSPA